MTVCIAASCEHGKVVVAATDGALSYGGLTADTTAMKGRFFDDWLFMYSGDPSSADLIADHVRVQIQADAACLERKNITSALRRAYRRHLSLWASDEILSPFDLDIDEFKKEGIDLFGEKVVSELALSIRNRAQEFNTQILLVGWGATGRMPIIREENFQGSVSHSTLGIAAIGSGGTVAMSQMLLLGQGHHIALEDTLYAVAAAKFAAEQTDGVGKETTILVLWKRRESDDKNRVAGKFIEKEQLEQLRKIWEQYGRPQVPFSCYGELVKITKVSEIPNDTRSESGAVSAAKWKYLNEKIKGGLETGETGSF